jgi:hypothetical protein
MSKRVLFTTINDTDYLLCNIDDICERCQLKGHTKAFCRTYILKRNPPLKNKKQIKNPNLLKKRSNNIFDILNSDDEDEKNDDQTSSCNETNNNKNPHENKEEEKRRQNEFEDIMNILR